MAGKNSKKDNKGKKLLSKFLRIFLLVFALLILIVGLGTVGYVFIIKSRGNNTEQYGQTTPGGIDVTPGNTTEDSVSENEKKMITFAVFGVDEDGYRTDVTMLVFFDSEDLSIDVISIPRDTQVKIPDEIYAEIQTRRTDVPQMVKVNGVPAYTLESERNDTSVAVLEYAFGVDIDYYINLDLDGFVEIVDLVGPITYDVPFDMVYDDDIQNLHINISAGEQEIWGTQAEEIIRYRAGYANGDLGRINTQHDFMMAFMDELLQLENKLNIVNIASTGLLYVDTNFTDAIDYISYIDDISVDNLEISTIPGNAAFYNGVSYYIYDYDETKAMLNNIVNSTDDIEEIEEIEEAEPIEPELILDAKVLPISVQNGTDVSGLAGRTKEMLSGDGYDVIEAIDYENKPVERTMIYVPAEDVGVELAEYFNNPEIIVDETMLENDIQIIVVLGGTDDDI